MLMLGVLVLNVVILSVMAPARGKIILKNITFLQKLIIFATFCRTHGKCLLYNQASN